MALSYSEFYPEAWSWFPGCLPETRPGLCMEPLKTIFYVRDINSQMRQRVSSRRAVRNFSAAWIIHLLCLCVSAGWPLPLREVKGHGMLSNLAFRMTRHMHSFLEALSLPVFHPWILTDAAVGPSEAWSTFTAEPVHPVHTDPSVIAVKRRKSEQIQINVFLLH